MFAPRLSVPVRQWYAVAGYAEIIPIADAALYSPLTVLTELNPGGPPKLV